jgi:hypothetical protein
MPAIEDIRWFKTEFKDRLEKAVRQTAFSVDMLTAIACQETGYIWSTLRRQLGTAEVLGLCVGDTIDGYGPSGRKAFPRNKADLLAAENGPEMFAIARQCLRDMARYIKSYKDAAANPDKFCRGFGIFQYDLQHFRVDPGFFLERRFADFDACLAKALAELRAALGRVEGLEDKPELSDYEMACVAIAYNTGSFKPAKALKQGYQSKDGGPFYGEAIFDFIRLARSASPDSEPPPPGTAPLPPPTPVTATGAPYRVDVRETLLNVRREPLIPEDNEASNVIAKLPAGHAVRAVTGKKTNGFLEIETSLYGALVRGFAFAKYLKPAEAAEDAEKEPLPLIPAAHMPGKPGVPTTRFDPAGARSLDEKNAPGRSGQTAAERCAGLAAIIDWLAVDNPAHARYRPQGAATFCNIYAHDYCRLAGAYLPRVWWTSPAILAIARGESVPPVYGNTIYEQRANDLFRWLRDFGLSFGWRQTGTLTKLQLEVNQGAIGLIIARRVVEGQSGHVALVVPETEARRARRSPAGEVTAPLQSQAGSTNFRYGTGKTDWWKDPRFAEFAYWLHA